MSERRNIEKQEAVVSALHALIRDNDAARVAGTATVTGHGTFPPYTFNLEAVGFALSRIMETFGYVVTAIQ